MVGIVGVGRVKKGKRPASEDTAVKMLNEGGCWLLLSKNGGQKKMECRLTGFAAVSDKIPHVGEPVLSSTITLD